MNRRVKCPYHLCGTSNQMMRSIGLKQKTSKARYESPHSRQIACVLYHADDVPVQPILKFRKVRKKATSLTMMSGMIRYLMRFRQFVGCCLRFFLFVIICARYSIFLYGFSNLKADLLIAEMLNQYCPNSSTASTIAKTFSGGTSSIMVCTPESI